MGTARAAAQATDEARVPAVTSADGEPSSEYRELIEQALAEHAAHNFAEARALFQRAHAIYPNARTLRGLGMMEFELKRYVECIDLLEQALASRVRPLDAALREHTEGLLQRARAFVGRYEIALQPPPPSVRIVVDGTPRSLRRGQPLTLAIGEHVVEVQAEGYQAEQRPINVEGGEHEVLTIPLQPLGRSGAEPGRSAAPELATGTVPEKDEGGSVLSSPWLWTGVGTLVVGGAVTALLIANHDDDSGLERGDVGGVVTTLRLAR
jgi:hypothetical protein